MTAAIQRSLAAASAVLAFALIATTAAAIGQRVTYPYELEWMEGATVVHVARVAGGESIYVEPSLHFVPFGYPALYYYAAAAATWFTGIGFLPLRLVSIGATLVTLVAIRLIVQPVSGRLGSLVAAGAFAGAYPLTDGWYDLGRVDALYVGFLSLGCAAAVRARTPAHWAAAGALAAAAFATKQPAVVVFAPLGLYLLTGDRRAAAWFGGTFVTLSAAFIAALTITSDGWYAYYVFQLPRLRMAVSSGGDRLLSFWTSDMMPFGIAVVIGAVAILRARAWRHAALAGGLIVSSWLSRLEGGAWNNAVIPAYLAGSWMLGFALRREAPVAPLRLAVATLQLLVLLYDPRPWIPTPGDRLLAARFIERLTTLPAPLVLDHSYLPTLAGRPEFAHGWAVTDVVWADGAGAGRRLEQEIRDAIGQHRFGSIILDDQQSWFSRDVKASYREGGEVQAPLPPSGAERRPRYLFTPR